MSRSGYTVSACAASRSNAVIAALEVGQMRPKCLRPTSSWYSMTRLGLMVRSHLLCASLRRAMRCCARDSNSMYFSGGVHTYAALRAGASTPYKRWSKCTMKKNMGEGFCRNLGGKCVTHCYLLHLQHCSCFRDVVIDQIIGLHCIEVSSYDCSHRVSDFKAKMHQITALPQTL